MVTMDGSSLRFDPSGELTIYQVEEIRKQIVGSFAQAKEIMIDLTRNDKIDTAGFQLLLSLIKSCKTSGKTWTIEGMGGSAENFMALFGYEWDAPHKGEV